MDEIRTFIAIELPGDIKTELRHLMQQLRPGYEDAVKWVSPENVHLTLKFLGNIPTEQVKVINQAIEGVARKVLSFQLQLHEVGAFPNLKSPRVIWVGVRGDVPAIIKLQREIDEALLPLGFPVEKKVYTPHLTLGRVRNTAKANERTAIGSMIRSIRSVRVLTFPVERISFMKSTLTPSGAIYDQIATIPLDKK